MSAGINYYPGRRRRPTLQTYSIQHSPDGIGSLFEYSRTLVQKKTSYDEEEEEPASGPEVQPFSFACELAHGSRQVRVSGFTSIPDLYKRIAELFKIEERNIMYCTLDTGNVDMDKLLSNQLAFNHTIYVHVRGQTKEVRFTKKAEKLGITLADNKAGGVFIKRITPGGVMDEVVQTRAHSIAPGDMIECINGRAFSQCRHLDVMHYLKALPVGSDIVLRLISPEKSLLPGISKRQKQSSGIFGRQTIRITATKAEIIAALNEEQTLVLKQMSEIVDEFLGIADEELAQTIFDIASTSADQEEFLQKLQENLSTFNFPKQIALKFWWAYETYESAVMNRRQMEVSPE